jgi:hypothetical protein
VSSATWAASWRVALSELTPSESAVSGPSPRRRQLRIGHQVGIGRGFVGFGAVSLGGVLSKSTDLYVVGSGSITWESGIPGGISLENVAGVVIGSEAGNSGGVSAEGDGFRSIARNACNSGGVGSEAVHFAVDNSKGNTVGSVISEAVDFEAITPGGATCESVTLEAAAFGAAKSAMRWVQAWIDAYSPPDASPLNSQPQPIRRRAPELFPTGSDDHDYSQ